MMYSCASNISFGRADGPSEVDGKLESKRCFERGSSNKAPFVKDLFTRSIGLWDMESTGEDWLLYSVQHWKGNRPKTSSSNWSIQVCKHVNCSFATRGVGGGMQIIDCLSQSLNKFVHALLFCCTLRNVSSSLHITSAYRTFSDCTLYKEGEKKRCYHTFRASLHRIARWLCSTDIGNHLSVEPYFFSLVEICYTFTMVVFFCETSCIFAFMHHLLSRGGRGQQLEASLITIMITPEGEGEMRDINDHFVSFFIVFFSFLYGVVGSSWPRLVKWESKSNYCTDWRVE